MSISPSDQAIVARTAPSSQLHAIWTGRGTPATRWGLLIRAVGAFLLAIFLYQITLIAVRWHPPLQYIGWLCLALTLAALVWSAVTVVGVVRHMGLKRLLIRLVALILISVLLVGLLVPTGFSGIAHWRASATRIGTWIGDSIGALARSLMAAPQELEFAASGRRSPVPVPGVDWPNGVPPTPIVVRIGGQGADVVPGAQSTVASTEAGEAGELELRVGERARVTGTDGARLLVRTDPAANAQVVARVSPGSILTIVDGPHAADGQEWWRVRGEGIEGWCAGAFLSPLDT